jgi:hypothetical protein
MPVTSFPKGLAPRSPTERNGLRSLQAHPQGQQQHDGAEPEQVGELVEGVPSGRMPERGLADEVADGQAEDDDGEADQPGRPPAGRSLGVGRHGDERGLPDVHAEFPVSEGAIVIGRR